MHEAIRDIVSRLAGTDERYGIARFCELLGNGHKRYLGAAVIAMKAGKDKKQSHEVLGNNLRRRYRQPGGIIIIEVF